MRRRETEASGRWTKILILTAAVLAIGGGRVWAHDGGSEGGGSDHPNTCRPACNQVRGSCKDAAGTAYQSCSSQCKAALMTENCFHVCREEAKSARSACRSDCHDCKMTCPPTGGGGGGGGGACDDACMADLSTCVSGLRSAAKECGNGCAETAQSAFGECLAGDEPLSCLVQATGVLGHCLGECAGTLREGNDACKEAADVCRGNCQTGSASRAFLDPRETLLD
jgi:hypothetical protein